MSLARLVLLAALAGAPQDWGTVWRDLESVAGLEGDERARRLDELEQLARRRAGSFRARLLEAHLARLRAPDAAAQALAAPPEPPEGLDAREAWLAIQVLEPGPLRASLAAQVLREADEREYAERLGWTWTRVFQPAAEGGRQRDVLELVQVMHERSQAVWSAMSLSLLLRRLGEYEAADDVLAAQLARGPTPTERTDLVQGRALTALAAGQVRRARALLGDAFASGSTDAGTVLGVLELAAGRRAEARRLFGSLLREEESPAWALRGWGIAMLP